MGELSRLITLIAMVAGLLLATAVAPAPASDARYLPIDRAEPSPIDVVVVVAGDHLWGISERHLASIRPGEGGDVEVARYWRKVIAENLSSLRSGDPDLIFPGEIVTLPDPG